MGAGVRCVTVAVPTTTVIIAISNEFEEMANRGERTIEAQRELLPPGVANTDQVIMVGGVRQVWPIRGLVVILKDSDGMTNEIEKLTMKSDGKVN
jgi:hypothetical protein